MPLWRCPHCGTPQSEAARCWVCRRSTTSCASCRHFRRGVAGGLGFCALDRRRLTLRGDEIRACWTAATDAPSAPPEAREAVPAHGPAAAVRGDGRVPRTFVPIDEIAPPPPHAAVGPAATPPGGVHGTIAVPSGAPTPRWSLWGDAEG